MDHTTVRLSGEAQRFCSAEWAQLAVEQRGADEAAAHVLRGRERQPQPARRGGRWARGRRAAAAGAVEQAGALFDPAAHHGLVQLRLAPLSLPLSLRSPLSLCRGASEIDRGSVCLPASPERQPRERARADVCAARLCAVCGGQGAPGLLERAARRQRSAWGRSRPRGRSIERGGERELPAH